MFIYIYEALLVFIISFIGYNYPPFHLSNYFGALFGFAFGVFLILLIIKIKKSDLKEIWSSLIGFFTGLLIGYVLFRLLELTSISFSSYLFFKSFFLIAFPFTGLFIGIQKPNMFSPASIKDFFKSSNVIYNSYLLDTSAIIDGRIVPIVSSGFIEGELIITQFVLAELQHIADSNDVNKKIRGKRGLEVIEQLQKNKNIFLTINNKNIGGVKEVDQKLVLFAKDFGYKIITNDINLSKVAKLQNVKVLNVNELAFALKPIVYPGEKLKISIVKEGKEKSQGIGYLDDGTMIVVDHAKDYIGQEIEIEVTSVLQSTTGKMIFGIKKED